MADPINPPPRRRIRPVAAPPPTPPQAVPRHDGGGESYVGPAPQTLAMMTVRQRIDALRVFDPEAAEELAIDTVNQYMMAGASTDIIASRMDYSVGWVSLYRKKVRERYKAQVEALDIKTHTFDMMAQLKEIASMGFREASAAGAKEYGRRMAGLTTARNAIQDQAKLLHLGGAFEMSPLRPTLTTVSEDDPAAVLRDLSRAFLSGVYEAKGIQPGDVIIDQEADEE